MDASSDRDAPDARSDARADDAARDDAPTDDAPADDVTTYDGGLDASADDAGRDAAESMDAGEDASAPTDDAALVDATHDAWTTDAWSRPDTSDGGGGCTEDLACVDGEVCFGGRCVTPTHDPTSCRAVTNHDYTMRCGRAGAALYEDVVTADGPLALWQLDDPSATPTLRDSIGARHLTVRPFGAGGTIRSRLPGLVHGGFAADFDRAYGVADHATAAGMLTFTRVSLEFWARPEDPPSFIGGGVFAYRELHAVDDLVGFSVSYAGTTRPTDPLRWEALLGPNDVTSWLVTSAPAPMTPKDHIVFTYDGSTSRVYVNGALTSRAVGALDIDPPTSPMFLGVVNDNPPTTPNFAYAGQLDEVALYDRALSPEEITEHLRYGRMALRAGGTATQSSENVSGCFHPASNATDGSFAAADCARAETLDGPGEHWDLTLPAVIGAQYVYVRFATSGPYRLGYRAGAAGWRVATLDALAGETVLVVIGTEASPVSIDQVRVERPSRACVTGGGFDPLCAVSLAELEVWGLDP